MSQQRFIRCAHCGLPHEADARTCPTTGAAITPTKRRRRPTPPPSEEDYAWTHTVDAPLPQVLDPADLEGFVGALVEEKYRVEALIGRGGSGAVYRAVNERVARTVALKVMVRGYSPGSPEEQRFLREARIAGSLGHPNIVEVYDLGRLEDGKPFQVMELLEGPTLGARIQIEGALPEAETLTIAEQLLSALAAAHAKGVVHRDLKPDNVVLVPLDPAPVAKIVDFGVSKLATDQSLALTQTGLVVGTPSFMAPEQARGDEVGPEVDVWAMGVLLYETLTGVLPFNAPTFEGLVTKILETDPVPPSRFQPRMAPEIEALILHALERDPAARPADGSAMLAALRDARERAERRPAPFDLDFDGAGDATIRESVRPPAPASDDTTLEEVDADPSPGGTG